MEISNNGLVLLNLDSGVSSHLESVWLFAARKFLAHVWTHFSSLLLFYYFNVITTFSYINLVRDNA